MTINVLFYRSKRSPVVDFINSLDKAERAKVLACLENIESLGFNSPRVVLRQIHSKLWEIKIRAYKSHYRIFYVMIQYDTMVLLHAYKKQSQKAPRKEISLAEKRLLEVLKNESDYLN
jgi:phage-related protein